MRVAFITHVKAPMLKISVTDDRRKRRLILEGKLIAPWRAEPKTACDKLKAAKRYLPDDLVLAHTSDQPLQVKENLDLFMDALYEAIVLVIVVSLIGFWEWRSAL